MFRQLIDNHVWSPNSFSVPFPGGEVSLNGPKQLFILSPSPIATPPMTHMGLTIAIAQKIPFISPAPVTFPVPSFTRASIATFVNSAGLIQVAPADTPRFDHDPVTLAPKGLLLEAEGANVISMTTDISLWSRARSTVTVSSDYPIFANDGVFLLTGDGTAGGKGTSRFF
jgi:hypothetical protein